jgi:hypothetical protein
LFRLPSLMSLALIVLLPHVLGPTPVDQGWEGGCFQTRAPKDLYGGPPILQGEPFLPKAKLTARRRGDNRGNAVIGCTVNLGMQKFCAPQYQCR